MGFFDGGRREDDSYYSSIYRKDLHIERSGGGYYIADSAGRPVGSGGGQMSSDRSYVERKLREYIGR